MANTKDIIVPDLGDFADVEVIEVLVGVGDEVAPEDGLITLETDKAAMDVPAPDAGTIVSLTVDVGDKVSTGSVIGTLSPAAGGDAARPESGPTPDADATSQAAPAAQAPVADSGGPQTVLVPDIGDFADVDVIEVHVAQGDTVQLEDALVTLETDKAAMDVPSAVAGIVSSVSVSVGDKVSEGSPIAVIDSIALSAGPQAQPSMPPQSVSAQAQPSMPPQSVSAQAQPSMPPQSVSAQAQPSMPPQSVSAQAQPSMPPQSVSAQAQPSMPPQSVRPGTGTGLPAIDEAGFSSAHASPSVRKLARELGVNLVQVSGSGPKNRILHDDVKAFVKAVMSSAAALPASALPQVPSVDFAKFGEVEAQPLTRIQKISGPRLQASWINLPHVTQHDLADITDLEARRQVLKGPAKERGISLTPLAFVMKAVIATLREFPRANTSLSDDGQQLVFKKYQHLGFAADTEHGLMVPVIHNADQMDVYELAQQLGDLSLAAREGKLKLDQMQGASFTISSLGGIGGTAFTPIVNAPEVAILGVSRSSMQPVWNGKEFEPRLMLPFSLSYDHRVIDGAYAVRFTTFLAQQLADVDGLLEAIP